MGACAAIPRLLLVTLLGVVFGGLLPTHHHALSGHAAHEHEAAHHDADHDHDHVPASPGEPAGDAHHDDCPTCHLARSLSTPLQVAPIDLSPLATADRVLAPPAAIVPAPLSLPFHGRAPPALASSRA